MNVALGDPRLPQRFWKKVQLDSNGCWIWIAARDRCGYGSYSIKSKHNCAHRIAFKALIGIPDASLEVDHLCRVRACVNPAHMELVTHRVNTARGAGRAAAGIRARLETGRCLAGHDDWVANKNSVAGVHCRECRRQHNRDVSVRTMAAARAAGLTKWEYIAQYGRSRAAAERVLSGQGATS